MLIGSMHENMVFLLMQVEAGKYNGYSLTVTHRKDAKKRPGKRYFQLLLCSCF